APLDTDCFSSDLGVSEGGPYFQPPQTIREENSDVGSVDFRRAGEGMAREGGNNGIMGYEDLDAANAYIDLVYSFDNGATLQWLSGFASYERDYVQDNSDSPFLMNFQGRGEDFDQWSTELRFRSATDRTIEFEVGAFFQSTDLTAFSSSLRANVRRAQRFNNITEEVDFSAVFANITFNIGDNFAIDVGGRYQDDEKFATVNGYGGSWIFTECPESPCDPGLTPVDVVFDPGLDDYPGCEGDVNGDRYCLVDPASARLYVPVAPGTPLYAMPWRESRDVPVPWRSGNAFPVGLTAKNFTHREDRGEGPWAEPFEESGFSPQITLRYRAGDNATFYARYAESTKIGGFDTGQTSIPTDLDELTFETEDAEQIEIGVKGTLMDGRFSYDATIFELEVPNLQTTTTSTNPEQTSASVNAGQRVRGLEFSTLFAASENWRFGFAGAFMDGEMTQFAGVGCTDGEANAAFSDPNAPCQIFDDDGNLQVPPIDPVEAFDDFIFVIDRTGADAPRTPDWKFVLSADYFVPLGGDYEFTFNAKGYVSDGYILQVEDFDDVVKYDQHEDLNVTFGIRNVAKGWSVWAFGRNLLEARPTYFGQFDTFPDGLESVHLSPASFTTYGIRFEYLIQ
ncbi:MAG: TonB-dependent receptor, partial [Proteobacteria bacterium]|nr:TonB-dependent receptor [Pseudomonadota bacterium]